MLSPKAAGLAVKNGYPNVKVFAGGEPAWSKAEYSLEASVNQVRKGNILLIDLRSPDKFAAGHIDRAVNIPFKDLEKNHGENTFPQYKGALLVFTGDNPAETEAAVELMRDWSFTKAAIFPGNVETWQKGEIPLATGPAPAPAKLTYTRKLPPHEIGIADFTKALKEGGAVILDARAAAEFTAGHFPSAMGIPSEEMGQRFAEVPKDKPVYLHCSTGSRAEMAFDILKDKGYANVKLLKANIEFNGDSYKITE